MEDADIASILWQQISRTEIHVFIDYMTHLIHEEPPNNKVDLFKLIGDFLTDGMVYSNEEGLTLCESLSDELMKAGLREGYRETLIAEKLSNPIVLKELSADQKYERERYIDPLAGGNYNTEMKKTDKHKEL